MVMKENGQRKGSEVSGFVWATLLVGVLCPGWQGSRCGWISSARVQLFRAPSLDEMHKEKDKGPAAPVPLGQSLTQFKPKKSLRDLVVPGTSPNRVGHCGEFG